MKNLRIIDRRRTCTRTDAKLAGSLRPALIGTRRRRWSSATAASISCWKERSGRSRAASAVVSALRRYPQAAADYRYVDPVQRIKDMDMEGHRHRGQLRHHGVPESAISRES